MVDMALRPITRVGILFAIVTIAFLISQSFEERKTAFSCRRLNTCYNFGRDHEYDIPLPTEPVTSTSEKELLDGTIRYEKTIAGVTPDLLWLVLNRDAKSWSRDFNSGRRSAYDFLDVLIQTKLNLTETSLALMTSSMEEYAQLKKATDSLPFGRTTIYYRNDTGPNIPYGDRHQPALQLVRRSYIAKMRNYLMLRALYDEQHVVWVDADVAQFSPNIVQTMLHHSNTNSSAGIITARCQHNHIKNYDKNAWLVDRTVPLVVAPVEAELQDETYKKLDETRLYITDVMKGSTDNDIRPLDAVGGTILYIRAELIRLGANFPSINIVGTTWNYEGWIGVETEGLCYSARSLQGGSCWALGGSHHVRHSDVG